MLKLLWKFLNYWYFRYLLVTELYMVEQWEQYMIYIVFLIIFSILSIFNNFVVLGTVSSLLSNKEELISLGSLNVISDVI